MFSYSFVSTFVKARAVQRFPNTFPSVQRSSVLAFPLSNPKSTAPNLPSLPPTRFQRSSNHSGPPVLPPLVPTVRPMGRWGHPPNHTATQARLFLGSFLPFLPTRGDFKFTARGIRNIFLLNSFQSKARGLYFSTPTQSFPPSHTHIGVPSWRWGAAACGPPTAADGAVVGPRRRGPR